ncbi:MAG TPA: NEW3 domain-containing protein [Candidatus Limnocylindrales bacterium]|nr:NEW3 domain-containing protein [Candidatus Limnocylindrales bacterium]
MAPPGAPPSSRRRRLALFGLAMLLAATPPARAADEVGVTATLHVSPIVVDLELSASSVRIGQAVTARVTATNLGTQTVRSVTLSVRFEPVGLVPKGATTARLSQLKGGKSGEASFKLCGAAVGAYLVLAQAELDGATIESQARLLVVTEGRPAKC